MGRWRGRQLVAAVAAISVGIGVGTALATPGAGVSVATVLARATMEGDLEVSGEPGRKGRTDRAARTDAVVQTITIDPGGHTGWHTHPAPVLVLVKAGSLSFYSSGACTPRVYTAGEAFIDSGRGHVHIARNEGSVPLEFYAVYTGLAVGGAFRIDAPDPGSCRA